MTNDDDRRAAAAADSGFTYENIADAEWLVANMPGIRRFHDMATYERALICHTAQRFRLAAFKAGQEAERARVVEWLRGPAFTSRHFDEASHSRNISLAIERGEHKEDL